jgi:hypothetical protein
VGSNPTLSAICKLLQISGTAVEFSLTASKSASKPLLLTVS